MDLAFAAESLKPIPKDHILARKASDLDGLRQMAAMQHLELIKLVLHSYGGKATVDQIQQVLVPDVIGADWKKWWEMARRELKKDGHFQVPLKKTEPVVYQVQEVSLQDRLMGEFRAAKGLKARIGAATELLKNASDLADHGRRRHRSHLPLLNAEIATHQRTQPAVALEGIFIRDDLRAAAGLPPAEGEVTAAGDLGAGCQARPAARTAPRRQTRRALESFKAADPERWHDALLTALNTVSAKLCREMRRPADPGRPAGPAQGNPGPPHQPAQRQQRTAALARQGTLRLLRRHPRPRGLPRHAHRHGTRPVQRDDAPTASAITSSTTRSCSWNSSARPTSRSSRTSPAPSSSPRPSTTWTSAPSWRASSRATPPSRSSSPASKPARTPPSSSPGKASNAASTNTANWSRRRSPPTPRKSPSPAATATSAKTTNTRPPRKCRSSSCAARPTSESQLVRARGTDFAGARTDVASVGTIVTPTDLATSQPERFTILGAWDSDPEQRHHQLPLPGGPGAPRPQGRRRSRVRHPRRRPPPPPRLHPTLQDHPAPRSVGLA